MKTAARGILPLLAIAFLFPFSAQGQDFFTRLPGPEAGRIFAIECTANGDVVCLTQTRIYRASSDSGKWTPVYQYVGQDSNRKKIYRSPDGTLYACAVTEGLIVSTDHGRTWKKLATALGTSRDIVNSNGTLYLTGWGMVRASMDSGATWEERSTGLDHRSPTAIIALSDGTLLTSDQGYGIYRSLDGGKHWFLLLNSPVKVTELYIDPKGAIWACGNGGAYRSRDSGWNWEQINLPSPISSVRAYPSGELIACGGDTPGAIYRSTDGGYSWKAMTEPKGHGEHAALALAADGTGYCAKESGVLRCTSGTQSWQWMDDGMHSANILALAELSNGDIIASVSSRGLFRSSDRGQSWMLLDAAEDLAHVIELRCTNDTVYAATEDFLYRSTDNGYTWELRNTGSSFDGLVDLWIDPSGIYAARSGRVLYSSDGGATWKTLNTGLLGKDIRAMLRTDDGTFYIAAWSDGVYRSTDAGATWEPTGDFPPGIWPDSMNAWCLATDGANAIYVGTLSGGVFRSTDGGGHWLLGGTPSRGFPVWILASDARGNIYGMTSLGCSYLDNGTANWIPLTGVHSQTKVFMIDSRKFLHVGTLTDGVYVSVNPLDTAPPPTPILQRPANGSDKAGEIPLLVWRKNDTALFYEVQVSTQGKIVRDTVLYASTLPDSGRLRLSRLMVPQLYTWRIRAGNTGGHSDWSETWSFHTGVSTGIVDNGIPSFALQPCYPNPSSSHTNIPVNLPKRMHLRVELCDMLGRQFRLLYEGTRDPGPHIFPIPTAGLPSGIYFIRLRTRDGVFRQSLTVLR